MAPATPPGIDAAGVLGLGLLLLAACDGPHESGTLRVAAAVSLRDLLDHSAPDFEAAHPGTRLVLAYEASSTLARQIEAGAQFDVFVSADEETLDRVARRLVPGSKVAVLGNRLALVGRRGLNAAPSSPEDLVRCPGTLALAGPAVPAGKRARALLENLGVLDDLAGRIVNAGHVRAALALVEARRADWALVYLTDARASQESELLWADEPREDRGTAYYAALVAGASDEASELLAWLRSPELLREAVALGFTPPPP